MPKPKTTAPYSAAETKLLELLKKKGKTDSNTLATAYYGRSQPLNARLSVSGVLRGLRRKAVFNREKWKVLSSERRGPHPIEWWVG